MEQRRRQRGQRAVNQGVDDDARRHVAEVTEAHRDRGGNLADNVQREHKGQRLCKPLEVAAQFVGADVIVLDQNKGEDRPSQSGVIVGSDRTDAQQADQTAAERKSHQRQDKGRITHKFLAHGAFYQAVDHRHDLFRHELGFARRDLAELAGQYF